MKATELSTFVSILLDADDVNFFADVALRLSSGRTKPDGNPLYTVADVIRAAIKHGKYFAETDLLSLPQPHEKPQR